MQRQDIMTRKCLNLRKTNPCPQGEQKAVHRRKDKHHEISNNVVCSTSKAPYQLAHTQKTGAKTKFKMGAGMVFVRTNAAAGVFLNIYNTEYVKAFRNFLRMPPKLFDKIIERLTPAIVHVLALTLCTLVAP